MQFKKSIYLLLFLAFTSCKVWHTAEENGQKIQVETEAIEEDTAMIAMIRPYKTTLDAEMNVVIGTNKETMTKGKPESLLTNWFADAVQTMTNQYYKNGTVDFAVSNYGGIRIPNIAAGEITRGKIFELMPFDNMLVVIEMQDTTVQKLFNHMADDNGWPISSNVSYEIQDQKPKNILINGQPLESGKTYKVSISDYLANGGDKCYFLEEGTREDLGVLIRDVLIEYVEQETAAGRQIESRLDNRLKYLK
ncbi:MAG: 5'-nucleotidase C-terminal domain-containing protein [Saprospiraceae bacterium]|jgi:2',3'-cyclic-nucleotide 2'-phosphodiesterase (5'-nucleotidase family)